MDNATALEPTEEPKGSLWKLQGIFFQPKRTFEEINKKPTWLIVFILVILITVAVAYVVMDRIGIENVLAQQNPNQELTEQQQAFMDSPLISVFMYGSIVIGAGLMVLVTAATLLLLFWLAGSDTSFRKIFSVASHSFFAYSVVGSIISLAVILLAQDPTELDLASLVSSNLGALVDRIGSPVMFALLSRIDIFSFYCIFLLSLGMSIVGRKSISTAATLVILPWLLWVAIQVGIAAIFKR